MITLGDVSGDGFNVPLVRFYVTLPDSGTSVSVAGQVEQAGQVLFQISGSPLTAPAPPGSGSIYWNIQVDYTTGIASIQQSTSAPPAALANNLVIFGQTLASTAPASLALTASSDADTW